MYCPRHKTFHFIHGASLATSDIVYRSVLTAGLKLSVMRLKVTTSMHCTVASDTENYFEKRIQKLQRSDRKLL